MMISCSTDDGQELTVKALGFFTSTADQLYGYRRCEAPSIMDLDSRDMLCAGRGATP